MRRRQSLFGVFVVFAAWSCSSAVEPLEVPRDLTQHEYRAAQTSAEFGFGLFARVAASESEPNILTSPLSAAMALGMTMNGAKGTTLEQMRAVLGFAGMSESEINDAYRGLIAQLRARDEKVEFRLANSVWHERTFTVVPSFTDALRTHFDAEVAALDFAAPDAVTRINDWAAAETGGRVKNLLESIDPLEKMFLVNAVYFKAPWSRPFAENGTRAQPFRTLGGATVDVPMMMRDAATIHYTGDGVQLVELPYGGGAFSMVLVAPAQQDGSLSAVVDRLSPERWRGWLAAADTSRVLLYVPKFRFDYGTELKAELRELGMTDAFDPRRANFSGINTQHDDLHITRVVQKSFIDVHELGTEAAAATAVGVGVTSLPPTLGFDRPFLFAIRERSSGALLFMGRIGDPRG